MYSLVGSCISINRLSQNLTKEVASERRRKEMSGKSWKWLLRVAGLVERCNSAGPLPPCPQSIWLTNTHHHITSHQARASLSLADSNVSIYMLSAAIISPPILWFSARLHSTRIIVYGVKGFIVIPSVSWILCSLYGTTRCKGFFAFIFLSLYS